MGDDDEMPRAEDASMGTKTKEVAVTVNDEEEVLQAIPPPASWHQTVLHYCLDDQSMNPLVRLFWALSLMALVFMQMMALAAIVRALDPWGKTCDESGDCGKGFFCGSFMGGGICIQCTYPPAFCNDTAIAEGVDVSPSANDGLNLVQRFGNLGGIREETAGVPPGTVLRLAKKSGLMMVMNSTVESENWISRIDEASRQIMCDGCWKKITGYQDYGKQAYGNVNDMKWFDWTTMAMISIVIALTTWAECEDVKIAWSRLWRYRAPNFERQVWRCLLIIVEAMRHFMLVPLLVSTVPLFVLNQGGDALSQCLNTVAIVFILEIDDLAVGNGLGKKTQEALEGDKGMELRSREHNLFIVRRVFYQVVIISQVFAPLLLFLYGGQGGGGRLTDSYANFYCLETTFLIWFVAALIEPVIVMFGGGPKDAKKWAWLLLAWVGIFVGWLVVQTSLRYLLINIYNQPGIEGIGDPENGNFLEPLYTVREEESVQNPQNVFWYGLGILQTYSYDVGALSYDGNEYSRSGFLTYTYDASVEN